MVYEDRKKGMWIRHAISFPFIWSLIIPLAITDLWVEIYHHICFPLYGIPLVKRKNYIKIDRQKLKYLHPIDKIDCAYCGYANGFTSYLSEIAARTEKYWCAIKHRKYKGYKEPKHHKKFIKYGDKKAYEKKGAYTGP